MLAQLLTQEHGFNMGLRTAAEVQRYGGAVQYRASSGTGRTGVSARFWQGFGHRTGPKGSGTAVGFIWTYSRGLATILDPFRAILVILGPTPCLMCLVSTADICPVPTIQIVDASDKGSGPKSPKWPEMGSEWSPGPENRPK